MGHCVSQDPVRTKESTLARYFNKEDVIQGIGLIGDRRLKSKTSTLRVAAESMTHLQGWGNKETELGLLKPASVKQGVPRDLEHRPLRRGCCLLLLAL